MNRNCTKLEPRGLTLLELLVVVALLAMVTATVVTRLGGTVGPAVLGQALSQFEFSDTQLRQKARRGGQSVAMCLEIGTNRLDCRFGAGEGQETTNRSLGRGIRAAKYLSATQEVTHGTVCVRYSDRGSSESFALEIAGARDTRRWIVVAGITGQLIEVPDEAHAREILQRLAPPRLHAG